MNTTFEVLEHVMVPNHQVMSESEVEDLFAEYQISYEHLPKIYHDDPAVQAVAAEIGAVIRITRHSQTAGIAEYYRLVVKRPKK
ncbi:MAG: DNA-directed RNA polymerase subunit H [Methanomicrobiales archaeon]